MLDGTTSAEAQPSNANEPEAESIASAAKAKTGKQDRSTVVFPYLDLDNGIAVARAIHKAGAIPLARDQLAGHLGQSGSSGNFVLRLATARAFGLVESRDGKYHLTALGHEIVDGDEARAKKARVGAFLSVELYRKIYDEFRGKQLPPRPKGLEASLVGFGVAPKQKIKARYAFDKSARQAGFFAHGEDRLVEPAIVGGATIGSPTVNAKPPETPPASTAAAGGTPPARAYHPFIEGLLKTLPEPDTVWDTAGREKWLTAARNIFDLIYKDEGASGKG